MAVKASACNYKSQGRIWEDKQIPPTVFYLGWVSLDGVEDVDEDEEDGDEETHPARDALGVDKEADPADDDEEAGGEVEGDDVEADFPGQHQLEASNTATSKQVSNTEQANDHNKNKFHLRPVFFPQFNTVSIPTCNSFSMLWSRCSPAWK